MIELIIWAFPDTSIARAMEIGGVLFFLFIVADCLLSDFGKKNSERSRDDR